MTLPSRTSDHQAERPATIYDVAKRAGVSHQTVSRMLQGYEGIRPETRARVQAALDELEYRPNLAARSLATNRSRRIGALVYELLEVGPSKTIQGASDAARHAGYLLDIVTLDPRDDSAVEQALTVLRNQDLAGIVAFAPMDLLSDRIQRADFSVPVLLETDVDQAAAATAVTAPTLFIASSRPFVEVQRIHDARPDWYLGRTVGAGHFHHLLVPDQVNGMIDAFLAQVHGGFAAAQPSDY